MTEQMSHFSPLIGYIRQINTRSTSFVWDIVDSKGVSLSLYIFTCLGSTQGNTYVVRETIPETCLSVFASIDLVSIVTQCNTIEKWEFWNWTTNILPWLQKYASSGVYINELEWGWDYQSKSWICFETQDYMVDDCEHSKLLWDFWQSAVASESPKDEIRGYCLQMWWGIRSKSMKSRLIQDDAVSILVEENTLRFGLTTRIGSTMYWDLSSRENLPRELRMWINKLERQAPIHKVLDMVDWSEERNVFKYLLMAELEHISRCDLKQGMIAHVKSSSLLNMKMNWIPHEMVLNEEVSTLCILPSLLKWPEIYIPDGEVPKYPIVESSISSMLRHYSSNETPTTLYVVYQQMELSSDLEKYWLYNSEDKKHKILMVVHQRNDSFSLDKWGWLGEQLYQTLSIGLHRKVTQKSWNVWFLELSTMYNWYLTKMEELALDDKCLHADRIPNHQKVVSYFYSTTLFKYVVITWTYPCLEKETNYVWEITMKMLHQNMYNHVDCRCSCNLQVA